MASSTTTSKSDRKGGSPACRKCGKAGFADANGKLQHERRSDPAVYGGRRSDPAGKSKSGAKSDGEPDREHVLNRRIFGKREE